MAGQQQVSEAIIYYYVRLVIRSFVIGGSSSEIFFSPLCSGDVRLLCRSLRSVPTGVSL
jgi:hypothetical protein